MKLGATTMKMTMIVKQAGLAILVVLGSAYNAAVQAQPATTTTPATAEQEFFDAIKKGNSARVSELLKQQPSLIKATYKNGITMVMLAVYAHHPELDEAAANGFPDLGELIINTCANVNQKDDKRKTPLAYAEKYNHTEIAKLLPDHGQVQQ